MLIYAQVTTRASKNEIIKIGDNTFKVKVTARPERGKANEKVIELLAKHFKTAKSNVQIVAGKTAKQKLIEIAQN